MRDGVSSSAFPKSSCLIDGRRYRAGEGIGILAKFADSALFSRLDFRAISSWFKEISRLFSILIFREGNAMRRNKNLSDIFGQLFARWDRFLKVEFGADVP